MRRAIALWEVFMLRFEEALERCRKRRLRRGNQDARPYCLTGECSRTIDSLPHHSCSHCLSVRRLEIELPFTFVTCLFAVVEPVELWATHTRRPSAAANPQGVAGQMRRRLQGQRRPAWSRIPFGVRLRGATPSCDAEVFLTVRPGRRRDTLPAAARAIRAMCARALPRTTLAAWS